VEVLPKPTVIRHESVASYLDVTADVSGRGVGDVVSEIDGLLDGIEFPLEHHAELLGGHAERQADLTGLIGVAIAAIIAIFLLLQAAVRSWRLAVLAFATLPLAVAGGLAAVLLTGGTLTIGSVLGLVAVVGIVARAVVPLIRRFQTLERVDGVSFGPDLVVRGTGESLTPTLIAAAATAVLFAPIAVAGGVSGLEIVQPMAVVVLGGLFATALLSLFVVPILYLRFGFLPNLDSWTDELLAPAPEQLPVQAEPEWASS
jgi:Cu/Ag efflux pump CusA